MQATLGAHERAQKFKEYAAQTTGSENFHRHWMESLIHTDGIMFAADTLGAWWFVDIVASWQRDAKVRAEPFQVWELRKPSANQEAWEVTAWTDTPRAKADEDGPASRRLCYQQVVDSNFPEELSPFRVWVSNGTLLLPEEY